MINNTNITPTIIPPITGPLLAFKGSGVTVVVDFFIEVDIVVEVDVVIEVDVIVEVDVWAEGVIVEVDVMVEGGSVEVDVIIVVGVTVTVGLVWADTAATTKQPAKMTVTTREISQ